MVCIRGLFYDKIFAQCMIGTKQQPPNPLNKSISHMLTTVSMMVAKSRDPFLVFLYVLILSARHDVCSHFHRKALFLHRLSRREEAIESALTSIATYPFNWSAWTLLGECVDDAEEVPMNTYLLQHPFTDFRCSSHLSCLYFRYSRVIPSYKCSKWSRSIA